MRWTSNYWRLVAVIAAALITACSAPPEESGRTGNENSPAASSQAAPASQPANANVPEAVPQGNANSSPGATVSPLRNVPSSPPGPTPAPSSAENPAARVAGAAPAAAATGPKLVVVSTEKELDFGKQPQDKTLTRAIRIKNGGGEQLKIESVSPS